MRKIVFLTIIVSLLCAMMLPAFAVSKKELQQELDVAKEELVTLEEEIQIEISKQQEMIQRITATIQRGQVEINQRTGIIVGYANILKKMKAAQEESVEEGKEENIKKIEEEIN